MTPRTLFRYVRAAAPLAVALWLAYGLATAPELLSAVLAFAAVPLLVVVLPAVLIWAATAEAAAYELRIGFPTADPGEREDSTGAAPVTDGGSRRRV